MHTHTHTHTHMCVCVCVAWWVEKFIGGIYVLYTHTYTFQIKFLSSRLRHKRKYGI